MATHYHRLANYNFIDQKDHRAQLIKMAQEQLEDAEANYAYAEKEYLKAKAHVERLRRAYQTLLDQPDMK